MKCQFSLSKLLKIISISPFATVLFGATIYDSGVTALRTSDSTQLGRISRNSVISEWSAAKAFPGIVNPNTAYRYQTFSVPTNPFPYLQITFDDLSGTGYDFAAAYLNSYTPDNTAASRGLDVNYLGDPGSSGNYFGNVPLTFQVTVPSPANKLVIVVNDSTGTTNSIGANFRLIVEGFYDTSFNDTTPSIPEPATLALSGTGFALAVVAIYYRKQKTNAKR